MIWSDESLTGIDTNVVLRAVLGDDPEQSPIARKFFRSLTPAHRGFITQGTLVEVYWVLSRSVKLPHAQCLALLRSLIYTETLEFDDGEGIVRALALAEEGADFADALIEGAIGLFGADETVTFDRDAAERLGWRLLAPA
ncbi:MAG: type II toxin-antitoxin system VapC family toxin [Microbacterium sp.]